MKSGSIRVVFYIIVVLLMVDCVLVKVMVIGWVVYDCL